MVLKFPNQEFLDHVIHDLEASYVFFLLDHRAIDAPVVKVAFYAACEKMVRDDPIQDNPLLQAAVLCHIREVMEKTIETFLPRVERVFEEVVVHNLVKSTDV